MRRMLVLVMAVGAVSVLAGCVGDTGTATSVMATQATLNARGRTNNGPAYWWWEYGISRSGVTNGQGTKTARQGPASSASDVQLRTAVKSLARSQSYYFRACGQDQKAGSPVTCGRVLSFATAPGDSKLTLDTGSESSYDALYTAAPDTAHSLVVSDGDRSDRTVVEVQEQENASTTPPTGSDLVIGAGCRGARSESLRSYFDLGFCGQGVEVPQAIYMTLGPYNDFVNAIGAPGFVKATLGAGNDEFVGGAFQGFAFGGPGDDYIVGGDGSDYFSGDEGDDTVSGGVGNDIVYGGSGTNTLYGSVGDDEIDSASATDTVDCGDGDDVLYVTSYSVFARSLGCEDFTVVSAAQMRKDDRAFRARAAARTR